MNVLFLTIVNMSISASWLVFAVLLLRLALKKAPKWATVLLWGIVAVRLICPISLESPLSLIPSAETVPLDIEMDTTPEIDSGIGSINNALNPIVIESNTPMDGASVNPLQITVGIFWNVWCLGMAAMLLYMTISYFRLRLKMSEAVLYGYNIYQSEVISSPFVLGIVRPRIYLPFGLNERDFEHVVAHEQAHIRRKDHLWKPLGFLLLSIHWFNPLMWLSYILLCRDIELACDEKVIRVLGHEERADYMQALVDCSVNRRKIAACPLAFGEVGVKERVKSVMNYKKPAFWIVLLAVIACVGMAVCFLTNPITVRNPYVKEYIIGAEGIIGQVDKEKYESISADFAIGADEYGRAVFKDPLKAFGTMKTLYADALALIASEEDLAPISQHNYKAYKKYGWQVADGSEEEKRQAAFVSSFLDIYENSFTEDTPYADAMPPTADIDSSKEEIIASNLAENVLSLETLKRHQKEIWTYRTAAVSNTVDETFRKWGERIAAAGVNEERNGVDVYVYGFDKGDIGRFQKALGHLSYVLIEWAEPAETLPEAKPTLTLEDVVTLSAKGDALTWEDFSAYACTDVGSGLYLCVYEIDEVFYLMIGDGKTSGTPMFIRLCVRGSDAYADVTQDDVVSFIEKQSGQRDRLADIAELFEEIESSPAVSSNPQDYIKAHSDAYNKLVAMGEEALVFIFSEFLAGGQTGLHGHILYRVMTDILPDSLIISYDAATGQEYFDRWLESARSVGKQHDAAWLEEHVPAIALVLKMAGAEDGSTSPVTVTEGSRELLDRIECHSYIQDSAYARYLLVQTDRNISDVRVTSMVLGEAGMEIGADLYTLAALDPQKPLLLGVVFYGDMTTYGLLFTDADGMEYRYRISVSGKDGSLVLQNHTDTDSIDASESPLSFAALINGWDVWEKDERYLGSLTVNTVEFVLSTDQKRIQELGLTFQDTINGYYIHDEEKTRTILNLPKGTLFVFCDWTDLFNDPTDSRYGRLGGNDRWVATKDFSVFAEYLATYRQNIPPFTFNTEDGVLTLREILVM